MRKVLVTGCAGFIGSHLTEHLLGEGNTVIGIDGFLTNYDVTIKHRNLSSFINHPRFSFYSSLLQDNQWDQWLDGVEIVFHQAALPGVRSSWGKAFSTYIDHNVAVTQQLLEACRRVESIQSIVIASSSSVYGTMKPGFTNEEAPLHPLSPYGVTKLAMESLCQVYSEAFHLPIVLLRYFTVYGPRQRPDMSFHRFIRQIANNEALPIYGDGKQTRDFTFISDAVMANWLAAKNGKPGEVYNIGGNREVSLLEVVDCLGELMGRKPVLQFLPEQMGDSRHTRADISKAQQQLGYQPKVSLETGLQKEVKDLATLYGLKKFQ
ncbi:NAD-dependent epimerase/dehydratase family protein [Brevibacillus sp. SYSU BS000544]|uniref:NAD-dependent epimerase/dehydratase family protein n=1 Tax=Brevibacillus sp. SYSU BS000544 TaxID=3416443 RepID=UPI003CE5995C